MDIIYDLLSLFFMKDHGIHSMIIAYYLLNKFITLSFPKMMASLLVVGHPPHPQLFISSFVKNTIKPQIKSKHITNDF